MKKIKYIIVATILIIIILLFIMLNQNDNLITLKNEYYNDGGFITLNDKEVKEMINNKESFILFTYNNYCTLPISCETIIREFMEERKIRMISITFEDYKKTSLYNEVKYAPTVLIIKDGKIISYLDANKDEDLGKYQDVEELTSWIEKYVIIK